MPELTNKSIGICGAILLLIFDAWTILNCLKLRGADFFNEVLENMLPCGLILGIFAICVMLKKTVANKLGIVSMLIFGISAVIRFIIGIIYFLDLVKFTKSTNASIVDILKDEAIYLIEFFAYVPLLISVVFLIIYALHDKMKKITQVLFGISIIALAAVCVINIYQLVSLSMDSGLGLVEIYLNIFKKGYLADVLLLVGYALIFGSFMGLVEKKE